MSLPQTQRHKNKANSTAASTTKINNIFYLPGCEPKPNPNTESTKKPKAKSKPKSNSKPTKKSKSNPQPNIQTATKQPKYENQQGRIPVQPIKDQEVIQQVSEYLLNRPSRYKSQNLRDYTLWALNINIGLRAGDLVHLQISDVYKNSEIVDMMSIIEQKTGFKTDKETGEVKKTNKPPRIITFDEQIKKLLMDYINSLEDWTEDQYLFYPRGNPYRAMSVRNLNYKMQEIKEEMNLKFPFASHSMRKIFARERYLYFEKIGHPMPLQALSEAMNHSSLKMTRMYIGLALEDTAKIYTEAPILGLFESSGNITNKNEDTDNVGVLNDMNIVSAT